MKIWLDGKLVEQEEAKTSVFDHGTPYGDGIFEGIRFYNKRVFRLEDHMDRLYNCSHYLLLDIPYTQEELSNAVCETVAAHREDQPKKRRLYPSGGYPRRRQSGT